MVRSWLILLWLSFHATIIAFFAIYKGGKVNSVPNHTNRDKRKGRKEDVSSTDPKSCVAFTCEATSPLTDARTKRHL